jgi:hypothetical protein
MVYANVNTGYTSKLGDKGYYISTMFLNKTYFKIAIEA